MPSADHDPDDVDVDANEAATPAWAQRGVISADGGGVEAFQEAADEDDEDARAATFRGERHPLMAPLRPMYRFGVVKTWLAAIVIMWGLWIAGLAPVGFAFSILWLAYCVYSWVVPPLVRRRTA